MGLVEKVPSVGSDEGAAEFDHPYLTVDVALLTARAGALHALLVRRSAPPFTGRWALPGGFVRVDESLDEAAARVLHDKADVGKVYLEQLYTFGSVNRDPRTRVVTVAYYALVPADAIDGPGLPAGEEAVISRLRVPWEGETGGSVLALDEGGRPRQLAFDHGEILGMAVKRLRGKLNYAPVGFQLLPERFSLLDLQRVHETILARPLNKDSFRRRMLASHQLQATGERAAGVGYRPPELYCFVQRSAV
jgi:8-oxo-dGTP diphosphatase